jgi:hypothetical protein
MAIRIVGHPELDEDYSHFIRKTETASLGWFAATAACFIPLIGIATCDKVPTPFRIAAAALTVGMVLTTAKAFHLCARYSKRQWALNNDEAGGFGQLKVKKQYESGINTLWARFVTELHI